MILKEISNYLVVDQLNIENTEKYIFFLSHLSSDLYMNEGFNSKILTSSHIGNVLNSRKDKIPPKYFKILQNRVLHLETLPNGDVLKVTMFKDEEPSGNVLFHFEINSRTAIYLGHFKQITNIMRNKVFIDLVSKGVNYLYIDNTNAKSIYHSTEQEVSFKLKELLKAHTKIILNTPEFGYEDLINTFILEFNFKVYIHNDITRCVFKNTKCFSKILENRRDCEIAMIPDSTNLDIINKRLSLKKFATVRLFDFQKQFENKTYEKSGLYQLCYSSHISRMDMFALIKLIQPKYIKEIYPEFSFIPNFIKSASKEWKYVDESPENQQNYKNFDNIEDFAPKTRLEDTEYLESFIENALSENQTEENSDNEIVKSTDCEEILTDYEQLSNEIKAAVYKIPRRRKFTERKIIIDLCPERRQSKVLKKIECKKDNEISPQKSISLKTDEFASLMRTKFTNYPLNESSVSCGEGTTNQFANTFEDSSSIAINNENIQIDKEQKELKENYFSFLDENRTKINEKELQLKSKEISLVEKLVTDDNIGDNTSSDDVNTKNQQPLEIKNKIFPVVSLRKLNMKKHIQQATSSKENNEPKIEITFSLVEKLKGGIIVDPRDNEKIAGNLQAKSPEKVAKIDRDKKFVNLEDSVKLKNNSKSDDNTTSKEYNPFRKRLSPSKNHDSVKIKSVLNKSGNKTADNNLNKSIKKFHRNSKIKKIYKQNTEKNNVNDNKNTMTNHLRRSSTKKRKYSTDSVEAIEDENQEVIEIIDNSPPFRKTRRATKSGLVEIISKRKVTKQSYGIPKLYIDDDDDDE